MKISVIFSLLFLTSINIAASDQSFKEYESEVSLFNQTKQFKKMEEALSRVEIAFPDQSIFLTKNYYRAAAGYYEEGKFDEALSVISKALTRHPSSLSLKVFQARLLARLKRVQEANEILRGFPGDSATFSSDLKSVSLEIWSRYDLAACYSLLSNGDMSFSYATTVFFTQAFPEQSYLEKTLTVFEQEPDFSYLRNDKRYIELKRMIESTTFEEVVLSHENDLKKIEKVLSGLKNKAISPVSAITDLKKVREESKTLNTVSPVLLEIQKKKFDYLNSVIKILDNAPLTYSSLDFKYNEIVRDVEAAKKSQN